MVKMKNLFKNSKNTLKWFPVIFFVFYVSSSMAFNWDRCSDKVFFSGNGVGIFLSTSSFVSSTGSCKAIGEVDQKKYFIAQNYEPLKIDLARGGGEYLYAYAEFFGCTGEARLEYSGYLQRNFIKIYGEKLDNSTERIFINIEQIVKENKNLSLACSKYETI